MKRCPFCGADLKDACERCERCGERLDGLISPSESALAESLPKRIDEHGTDPVALLRGEAGEVALPPFPGSVLTAAVAWLVCGGLCLLQSVAGLLVVLVLPDPEHTVQARGVFACYGVFWLSNGFFLYMGRQTIRGKVGGRKMTLNGILSLLFGLIQALPLLILLGNAADMGVLDYVMPVVFLNVGIAVVFFIAGLLAMYGARAYRLWRQAHPIAR